jgi:multiple coagulation factor deficiency protein 2
MHVNHKDVSEMSDEEKSFYYFKIHDSDNNEHLDGLEMIKAAIHRHGNFELQDELTHVTSKFISLFIFKSIEIILISGVVDEFLLFADLNQDGFLNYAEYVRAMNSSQEDKEINPPLTSASLKNGLENV